MVTIISQFKYYFSVLLILNFSIISSSYAQPCYPSNKGIHNTCQTDLNLDGYVDNLDLEIAVADFDQPSLVADLNNDGIVTKEDINLILNTMGNFCAWEAPSPNITVQFIRTGIKTFDVYLVAPRAYLVDSVYFWSWFSLRIKLKWTPNEEIFDTDACQAQIDDGQLNFVGALRTPQEYIRIGEVEFLNEVPAYIVLQRTALPPAYAVVRSPNGDLINLPIIIDYMKD